MNLKRKIKEPRVGGVGMPETLLLDEFGNQVWSVFGYPPYLVGSANNPNSKGKWRDVDVRLILDDKEWQAWGFGDPKNPSMSRK